MTFNLIPLSNFAKAIKKRKKERERERERKIETSTIIDRFVTRARGEKSMAGVYSLTRQEFERASRGKKYVRSAANWTNSRQLA